jgi:hypothetical protein
MKRFVRFQRRINQKSHRTPCLQNRAMARMLWQERALRFTTWLQPDAGTTPVGKESNFHVA